MTNICPSCGRKFRANVSQEVYEQHVRSCEYYAKKEQIQQSQKEAAS